MDINPDIPIDSTPISGRGPFRPPENPDLDVLRSQLDEMSNGLLKEEKEVAANRLTYITPAIAKSAPAKIQNKIAKEQQNIGDLFDYKKEDIKSQVLDQFPQLEEKDADDYLDDLKDAWNEKFNVKSSVQAYTSEQGPLQGTAQHKAPPRKAMGSAPQPPASPPTAAASGPTALGSGSDPWLLGMLQRIGGWQPTGDPAATQFRHDIQMQALAMYNKGDSLQDFQSWFNTNVSTASLDVFLQYPGIQQANVNELYTLVYWGSPPVAIPTPTAMDTLYTTFFNSIGNTGPEQKLKQGLLNEIKSLGGSQTNPAQMKYWLSSAFPPAQDLYWQFPGITYNDAQALYNACGGGTAPNPTPVDTAYGQAVTFLNSSTGPAHDLANAIVNEIKSLGGSQGNYGTLQSWFKNTFTSNNDVYWQFPGITQQDAQQLYIICRQGSAPGPTPMDTLYGSVVSWLNSSTGPAKALAQALVNEIQTLGGSQGDPGALKGWATSTFSTDDVYMAYPGLSQIDAQQLYTFCGAGTVSAPTSMDNLYAQVNTWFQSASGQTKALANALMTEMQSLGSQADPGLLKGWATSTFTSAQDIYWHFPGITQQDAQQLYTFCGAGTVSGPTKMDTLYGQVYKWSQSASGETKALANALIAEIQTLGGSQGDPGALKGWVTNTFTSAKDIFWQFPGISQQDAQTLYNYCGAGTAPTETGMDIAYGNAYNWSQSATGQAQALANALVAEIQSLGGSQGDPGALKGWVANTFTSANDIYWQYPGLSPQDAQTLYTYCGAGNAPNQTDMDKAYGQAYNWLHQTAPPLTGPAMRLATTLMNEIKSNFNSQTPLGNLQAWFTKTFSTNDVYMQYLDITPSDAQPLFDICQEGTAPAPTAIDTAYTQTYDWINKMTPPFTGAALIRAQELAGELYSLGSQGNLGDFQSWLNNKFSPDDIFMQFFGITQDQVNTLYGFYGVTPPTETTMDYNYYNTYKWLQQMSPSDPAYPLAQTLLSQITSFGSSDDSFAKFQQWFRTQFESSQDVFFQYPGITQDEANKFYSYCGEGQAPVPTGMDITYASALQWLARTSPGPDHQLAQALVDEMSSIGSYGSLNDLETWEQTTYNSSAYSGASPAAQASFQQVVYTTMSSEFQNYYKSIQNGALAFFAQYHLGSFPPSNWATLIQNNPNLAPELERFRDSLSLFGDPTNGVIAILASYAKLGEPLDAITAWAKVINLGQYHLNPEDIKMFDQLLGW